MMKLHAYSPDLAPSDSNSFDTLKEVLNENKLQSNHAVKPYKCLPLQLCLV